MGWELIDDGKKPFKEMSRDETKAYKERVGELLNTLRTPRSPEKPDECEDLRYWLGQACECGIVFYPNGQPVLAENIDKMAANPATMLGNVSDLIVVKHDLERNTNECYPMNLTHRKAAMGKYSLTPSKLFAKEQEFCQKHYNAAQIKKLSTMETAERKAYVKDANTLIKKMGTEAVELRSQSLKECLEAAIDKGCVRTLAGVVPAKKNVEKFIRTPAFLKTLVFTQRSEKDYEVINNYRLIVSNENPPTVKLDLSKDLSAEDMGQMKETFDSLDKKEKVPGFYASALSGDNQGKIAKYEKEMQEFGYTFEPIDGMRAFRLPDEKQVYVYGNETPCNTPDEFVKAVRHVGKPTPPNKWGPLEFLRKGWHKIFNNLPDYQEYDKANGLYKIDRYNLAKQAGFDVSNLEDSAKRAEEKYGNLYDTYKTRLEAEDWVDRFSWRAESPAQKAFLKDFKEAMKQYPEIAKAIMESNPNVSAERFKDFIAASKSYEELSQVGNFNKEKLGVLSTLGVAADSGLFSNEVKTQIFNECKALNEDFGTEKAENELKEARAKKEAEKLENEKKTEEIKKQSALRLHSKEEKAEVVVVGGGNANANANKVIDLDAEEKKEKVVDNKEQKKPLDLDEVKLEEETPLNKEENRIEEEAEPRHMTEEEKRVIAKEYNDLTEGEKRQVQKLMEQQGFKNYDVFNLSNTNVDEVAPEDTVNENTNDEMQMGSSI